MGLKPNVINGVSGVYWQLALEEWSKTTNCLKNLKFLIFLTEKNTLLCSSNILLGLPQILINIF